MTNKVTLWTGAANEVKSPCKNCFDREIGCHGNCQKYKDYKADIEEINIVYKKEILKDKFQQRLWR